jgi:hypothetical protein
VRAAHKRIVTRIVRIRRIYTDKEHIAYMDMIAE